MSDKVKQFYHIAEMLEKVEIKIEGFATDGYETYVDYGEEFVYQISELCKAMNTF
jgi:hypothetical protein